jgi:hypothetical protein
LVQIRRYDIERTPTALVRFGNLKRIKSSSTKHSNDKSRKSDLAMAIQKKKPG